jgi:hypothetical protein
MIRTLKKILLGMARTSACHRPVNVKEPTFMTRSAPQPKHESWRAKNHSFLNESQRNHAG